MTKRRALLRHLHRFGHPLRGSRGVTAIEFAMVAPFLIIIILGTIEIGLDMWIDASVEAAAQRASRLGITTVIPTGQTREQAVQAIVNNVLSTWQSLNAVETTTIKSYSSYIAVGQPEPYTDVHNVGHYVLGDPYTDVNKNGQWDADQGTNGAGGYNDIVQYTITFTTQSFTGLPELLGMSKLTFGRTFIVQNETIQSATAQ